MCTISVKNPAYLRVIEATCGLTKRKSEGIPTLVIHNYSKLSTVIHSHPQYMMMIGHSVSAHCLGAHKTSSNDSAVRQKQRR